VEQWKAQYGPLCPGWLRGPHLSDRLTADHPREVVLGGDPSPDEFLILCMSCNSRKSNLNRAEARRAAQAGPQRFVDSSRDW
jgi:hypothetical protein